MLDKIFAIISMAGVLAFMGVVTIGVMEPDLWIVTITVIGIGILYFWQELKAGGSHFEEKMPSMTDTEFPKPNPDTSNNSDD